MKKYALLVGVNRYADPSFRELRFAEADALRLADRLRTRCRFHRVVALAGQSRETTPTLENIRRALQALAEEAGPEDMFLFYFSGHGCEQAREGYLLAQNTQRASLAETGLSLKELREVLAALQVAVRVMVIDACRRSHPDAKDGADETDDGMTASLLKDITAASGIREAETPHASAALLLACGEGQYAYESPRFGHGVCTKFRLEGLEGEAWNPHARRLEFRRLANYTIQAVGRWGKAEGNPDLQKPWYEESGGAEDILLVGVPAKSWPAPGSAAGGLVTLAGFWQFVGSGAYGTVGPRMSEDLLRVIWTDPGRRWLESLREEERLPVWARGNKNRSRVAMQKHVTLVSWYEAVAFCNWYTIVRQSRVKDPVKLQKLAAFKCNGEVALHEGFRLPTQDELWTHCGPEAETAIADRPKEWVCDTFCPSGEKDLHPAPFRVDGADKVLLQVARKLFPLSRFPGQRLNNASFRCVAPGWNL